MKSEKPVKTSLTDNMDSIDKKLFFSKNNEDKSESNLLTDKQRESLKINTKDNINASYITFSAAVSIVRDSLKAEAAAKEKLADAIIAVSLCLIPETAFVLALKTLANQVVAKAPNTFFPMYYSYHNASIIVKSMFKATEKSANAGVREGMKTGGTESEMLFKGLIQGYNLWRNQMCIYIDTNFIDRKVISDFQLMEYHSKFHPDVASIQFFENTIKDIYASYKNQISNIGKTTSIGNIIFMSTVKIMYIKFEKQYILSQVDEVFVGGGGKNLLFKTFIDKSMEALALEKGKMFQSNKIPIIDPNQQNSSDAYNSIKNLPTIIPASAARLTYSH